MDLITPIPSPSLVPTVLVLQHNTLCAQRGGQLLGNNNVTLHILSAPPIYPPSSSCLVYQTLMRKSLDYQFYISLEPSILYQRYIKLICVQISLLRIVNAISFFFLIRQSPNSGKQDQVQIVTCALIIMYTVVVHIFPSYSILYHTFI